ncbi:MAG: riboflavin synthase [Planctomycetota bacterium]|nr:riboflavin synthase [Planctomycetota bacterium]
MFSGIVEHRGVVGAVEPCDSGRTLAIDPCGWGRNPAPGDSIAVNGCCLTVTAPCTAARLNAASSGGGWLRFDVIRQTLGTTTLGDLGVGDPVNLESAITPTTLLSGHLVQGHIDGIGAVCRVWNEATQQRLRIEPPSELLDFIVDRGAIAVDGVSLTVATLGESWFEIALIPTTTRTTVLGRLQPGDSVNLETDYLVKTIVHWLRRRESTNV